MDPATYGCERVEDEPVFLRLRSARQDTSSESGAEPVIDLTVMPFTTWQVVKRRIKERWPGIRSVPDPNIRLLHKSIELRSGSMIDDYNVDGGTADRPAELQYLIIHQGADANERSVKKQVESPIGLYVDAQVPCTPPMRDRVNACLGSMLSGILPRLTDEGTGATYMLRDASNRCNLAVFKPKDEEAFAPQNPRGYIGKENTPGLRQGVLSTQQAAREVAAHLLDHDNFAFVPETSLVHAKHPKFSKVIGKNGDKVVWKIGAFQAFVDARDTASNFAPQVYSVSDVHRIGILDVRIVNLDRNDGNLLIRHGRTSKHELVPIDHGLSLPDRLEVYTDDMCWMSWPQAKKPFGDKELCYIRALNGSRDARLLAKHLCIRRECLRLMEVTTKLLQVGAEHGLTLYEIGTILYRVDRGSDAPVQKSKLEQLIEHSLDTALTVAGEGLAADSVSSTLAGLDLNTSRRTGGKLSQALGGGRKSSTDILSTPLNGPSSPIASPLSTLPAGMDMPPPFSLDGLSDSEELDSGDVVRPLQSTASRIKAPEDGDFQSDLRKTPRTFRQSYKTGGTKLRTRSSALAAKHNEGDDGMNSIFYRPGLRPSDWTPELEKTFKRHLASQMMGFVRKNFRSSASNFPDCRQTTSATDEEESEKLANECNGGRDDARSGNIASEREENSPTADRDTSLASAFPSIPFDDDPPTLPRPDTPAKRLYVPPHVRRAAEAAAAKNETTDDGAKNETENSTVSEASAPTQACSAASSEEESPPPVLQKLPARPHYVPPQRRLAPDEIFTLPSIQESVAADPGTVSAKGDPDDLPP